MKILIIFWIVTISIPLSAQISDAGSARKSDSLQKTEKQIAKDQKKALKNEIKNRTINFVQLIKFPMSFTGRPLRLEKISLTDIQPFTDAGETNYLMALGKGEDYTLASFISDKVTFAMTEPLARSIVSQIDSMRTGGVYRRDVNPIVDVFFELFQRDVGGSRIYIARVDCVNFYGFFSKVTTFGNCKLGQ